MQFVVAASGPVERVSTIHVVFVQFLVLKLLVWSSCPTLQEATGMRRALDIEFLVYARIGNASRCGWTCRRGACMHDSLRMVYD